MTFQLGKIPVRVAPSFFLVALFLGFGSSTSHPIVLVSWTVVVFVSVLLHELGHATMGLTFGLEPRIDLHGMGGTTSWSAQRKLATWQRVAISLAGPVAGFAVWAAVYAARTAGVVPRTPLGGLVCEQMYWVNVGWGVLNLLPMLPLDGGNVLALVLGDLTKGHGQRPAHVVSIAVAVLSAAVALLAGQWWPALLAFSFIATNWRGLQALKERELDAPLRASLEEAYKALDARDGERILALARPVALASKTAQVRAEALQLVAFGFLLTGHPADADAAIAGLPKGFTPHPSLVELRASAGKPPPGGA